MNKRAERIFNEICSSVNLTEKEQQLYKYLLEWASSDMKDPTIKDICKALHTTPKTYFKTYQSLKAKGLTPA